MSMNKTPSPRRAYRYLVLGGLLAAIPVLSAVGCAPESETGTDDTTTERTASPAEEALNNIQREPHKALSCGTPVPGAMRCHARVRTEADGTTVKPFATPSGLTPANIQAAYKIPATGTGTIAIVDAYDDPNAESDLAVYRKQFGLPACTTANGCFKKVGQDGSSKLPKADSGWAGEISLDLDMVSAACPNCNILLVEANSASNDDLGAAVNTAASLGADAISNSYGGSEDSSNSTYDSEYYNHPGIIITASSGDNGYGVEYPASGAHVFAVGGTSLTPLTSSTRGWTEGAWSGAGSGCSKYTTKPSFQKDANCAKRTVADLSAVADPNTGVAVYDTYGGSSAGATGWVVYGGTSASSPLVASILIASGKKGIDNSWPYSNTADFYDVTSGTNGSCSGTYLCTAKPGYDGPTGLGTPNGGAISGGATSSSSSSSSSTSSTSSSSSSGSTGGTCSHNECTSGSKLTTGCDPCVTKICASDSYCCSTSWDSVCVGEASSVCGETCGGGSSSSSSSSSSTSTSSSSGGTCSHNECTSGSKLTSGCDSCVTKICKQDSYCCSTKWDSVCVSEVKSICSETCK